MNKELQLYKLRAISWIIIISYSFLHLSVTGQYVDATLVDLMNFSARLPFGQRLLIPTIAHWLAAILPLNIKEIFLIIECIINGLCYLTLKTILCHEFNTNTARLLSWLFFLLLPLITTINYGATRGTAMPAYYPYDSAALLCITAGLLFAIRKDWAYFIILIFFATLSRETSFLTILLIPALYWKKLLSVSKPIIISLLTYIFARLIVFSLVFGREGNYWEWYHRFPKYTHFENNLLWLLNEQNIILFIFCFAGFPIFWFAFYDYIPPYFRSLRYVLLFDFLCLLLFGNILESRIFMDMMVLLYFPICLAIKHWLLYEQPYPPPAKINLLYYINRYSIIIILVMIGISRSALNSLIVWCATCNIHIFSS